MIIHRKCQTRVETVRIVLQKLARTPISNDIGGFFSLLITVFEMLSVPSLFLRMISFASSTHLHERPSNATVLSRYSFSEKNRYTVRPEASNIFRWQYAPSFLSTHIASLLSNLEIQRSSLLFRCLLVIYFMFRSVMRSSTYFTSPHASNTNREPSRRSPYFVHDLNKPDGIGCVSAVDRDINQNVDRIMKLGSAEVHLPQVGTFVPGITEIIRSCAFRIYSAALSRSCFTHSDISLAYI